MKTTYRINYHTILGHQTTHGSKKEVVKDFLSRDLSGLTSYATVAVYDADDDCLVLNTACSKLNSQKLAEAIERYEYNKNNSVFPRPAVV